MSRSLRTKLLTSFLLIIAVLAIAEGFFIVINFNIIARYEQLANTMTSEYGLIDATTNTIEAFKNFTKDASYGAKRSAFFDARNQLKSLLTELDTSITDPDSRAAYIGAENTINNVLTEVNTGFDEVLDGDYSNTTAHYDAANHLNDFVRSNTTELLLKQLAYAKTLETGIREVQIWSEVIGLLMFALILAGCLWYSVSFSSRLIGPLSNLTRLAKKIEGGDLQAAPDQTLLQGDDEVASLANSFNTMVLSLRQDIKKLQEYNVEIKNSRNRLKSEKNKLQQYLDIAGVIVLIFSPENNHVFLINKKGREILGIQAAEIMGRDWVSLFVAKASRVKTKSFLNLFAGGLTPANDTLENVLVTKGQKEKNIVWHFSPLQKETGAVEAILATGVDVTELTAAKITINQLKEVDRLKNEVMNIATHELKTPLISIVGLSEVMEKKPENLPPDYRNYISIIHQEGTKLANLIKSMLAASRNELGQVATVKEPVDLAELLRSLETPLKVLTKRTDSQIIFKIKNLTAQLASDKDKISQVIYNFVDNAVKYGPKNQTITITLSQPEPQTAKVEVAGAGPGISPDDQKKLFLKFSQLEPSLSRSQDGMGLGLYICKQNIENLGGQIGVVSQPKQGATFYFTLPLNSTVAPSPVSSPAPRTAKPKPTSKNKVKL
jgi:PAS domain S-box-containing protein